MVAIDLGSNTLRVLAYDCEKMEAVAEFEKIVKTADGLGETGLINDAALQRVIEAIREAQAQIDFSGQTVHAVTTEAVRRASNRDAVLARIEAETGVKFEIISGEREAHLTLLAVRERLKKLQYASEAFVLVDIGGGSTELTFCYADETITKSFPIGIVTIAQQYGGLDAIREALPQKMRAMEQFVSKTVTSWGEVASFVATAGTPTTVAAMKLGQSYATYDAAKINGTILAKEELWLYLEKLLAMPFEKREEAVGTGRSDLIAAGILIFERLYTILGQKQCIVIDDGLREGVALEECLHKKTL